MKSCPQCTQTYADDSLVICLEDGASLSAPFDAQATLRLQSFKTIGQEQKRSTLAWWSFIGASFAVTGFVFVLDPVFTVSFWPSFNSVTNPGKNDDHIQQNKNVPPRNANEDEEIDKTLRSLFDKTVEAYLHNDVDFIESVIADDYVGVSDKGVTIKKGQILSLLRAKAVICEDIVVSELSIKIGPDKKSADATGHISVKARINGRTVINAWRFLDVYEKHGGRWQNVPVDLGTELL